MADKKFAGLAVKSEISLGNIIVALSLLASVTAFGISLQKDIERNALAIKGGILPLAEKRVTTLETQVKIEIVALRREINALKDEVRTMRLMLNRTEAPSDLNGG